MEFLKSDGARTGLFFGATSGVITTIGLIVGLNSGTRSIIAVLGGILVIAVADAMSDALSIHRAEESDPETDHGHVWAATIMTFVTKFVFSISFAVPLLLLPLGPAVIASDVFVDAGCQLAQVGNDHTRCQCPAAGFRASSAQ